MCRTLTLLAVMIGVVVSATRGQCGYEIVGRTVRGGGVGAPFAIDAQNSGFWTNGGIQYVATGIPDGPVLTSFVDLGLSVSSVSRQGNIHFIGNPDGLRVLDVSIPGSPKVIAVVPELRGQLTAYDELLIGSGVTRDGPVVYDISDPANPVRLSPDGNGTSSGGVARSGNIVWERIRPGSGFAYIQAWDISDPANAVALSQFEARREIYWMYPFGEVLYYIENDCLKILDYTDLNNPVLLLERCEVGPLRPWLIGDTLYLRTTEIITTDVSDPRNPVFLEPARIDNTEGLSILNLNESNGLITASLGQGGFATVDEIERGHLRVTGRVFQYASFNNPQFRIWDRVITNVAESGRLLTVLSRENPAQPEVAWQHLFERGVGGPVLDGDIGFLAFSPTVSEPTTIFVYDFSIPDEPSVLTSFPDSPGFIQAMVAEPGRLYTLDYNRRLRIYDTSNPLSILLLGESDLPAFDPIYFPLWIRRAGDVMYVHGWRNRDYRAIDISDESNPRWIEFDRWNTFGVPTIRGNRLYNTPRGVGSIFDISNAPEMSVIGQEIPDVEYSLGEVLDVRGFQRILVVDNYPNETTEEGILIQSILDPDAPEELLFIPGEDFAGDYAIAGDYAYMMRRRGGIVVYKISDCGPCVADYSGDGVVNFFDLAEFLSDYNARTWKGDLTQDAVWDMDDVSFMIDALLAGCP